MESELSREFDESLGLSLPYRAQRVINAVKFEITRKDRRILRELAQQLAELAARPAEEEKRALWYAHNQLQPTRPLVHCDPEFGWYEIIGDNDMRCCGRLSRIWEFKLRKEIFWASEMRDDKVIEPRFVVNYAFDESDYGLPIDVTGGQDGGAYSWVPPLDDLGKLADLRPRTIRVDARRTKKLVNLTEETFADILEVQLKGIWWHTLGMTQDLVKLRGMQNLMTDIYDHPDTVRSMMAFLRDDALGRLDFLEEQGLLSLNNAGDYVGSGGFGWSRELPASGFAGKVRANDMWGYCESQETVGISPTHFAEFVFPYQLPILQRFGLNYYGCCEPLDHRWESIARIPRLRRVSVSPWADIDAMAEKLGSRFVFVWKPNPADLAGKNIDEEVVRLKIRRTLSAARGCCVEMIMKDNHTIGGNPRNVVRWTEIALQEARSG